MTSDLTLYEITDTLPALLDSLEMTEAESTERAECEAEIAAYMAALPSKVDGVARMLKHFEAQAEMASKEIARLQARKRRFETAGERLKEYVMDVLAKLDPPRRGPKKLEGGTVTLSLCASPGALVITDEKKIPARFQVVIPARTEIDRAAVKDAIRAGEVVPGAEITKGRRLGVS